MFCTGPAVTLSRERWLTTEVPSTVAVMVASLARVPLWNCTLASPEVSVVMVSFTAVPPKVPTAAGEITNSTSTPGGTGLLSLSSTVAVMVADSIPPVPLTCRRACEVVRASEAATGSTRVTVVEFEIPVATGPL